MGWTEMDIKGFTLVEILITMSIVFIIMLAITEMFIVGERGIYQGRKGLFAIEGVRSQMEILLNRDIYVTGSGPCTTIQDKGIQCMWSIIKDYPGINLTTLKVSAEWQEGTKKKSYILRTIR